MNIPAIGLLNTGEASLYLIAELVEDSKRSILCRALPMNFKLFRLFTYCRLFRLHTVYNITPPDQNSETPYAGKLHYFTQFHVCENAMRHFQVISCPFPRCYRTHLLEPLNDMMMHHLSVCSKASTTVLLVIQQAHLLLLVL